jgi:catechol 2,3-dioxygenase-like lactoylglutathione lyase family enzyme
MEGSAMNAITLEHVNLNVLDLDRALAFYQRLLPGWVVRWDGRTSTGERWVHFGPAQAHGQPGYLSIYQDAAATKAGEGTDRAARIQHLGFAHPDVDALVAALAGAGITPTDRLDDGAYRRAYFEDPSGHEVEVVQRLA